MLALFYFSMVGPIRMFSVLQTQDPECLFSFHAGAIQGMDVSESSHLMATTALDCKEELNPDQTYTHIHRPMMCFI